MENQLTYRPEIDGLRALAVLGVLAFHFDISMFSGGFVGVDVFFVISGYLICGLLLREMNSTGRVDLLNFWARRFRRLLPTAVVVILCVLLMSVCLLSTSEQSKIAEDSLFSVLYLINWSKYQSAVAYFDAGGLKSPLLHYWSLAVEEQFYLFLSLLVMLVIFVRRLVGRREQMLARNFSFVLLVLVVLSFVASFWSLSRSQPEAFFGSHARLWQLGSGGLIAYLELRKFNFPKQLAVSSSWFAIAMLLLSYIFISSDIVYPGYYALIPTISAAVLLGVGINSGSQPNLILYRVLEHNTLRWIGKLSYSLYLWHWPVIVCLKYFLGQWGWWEVLVAAFATVILSVSSYFLIEQPVRNSSWLSRRPRWSLAIAALSTCVVVGAAVAVYSYARSNEKIILDTGEQIESLSVRSDLPVIYEKGAGDEACHKSQDVQLANPCLFGESTRSIHLFGDSHAAQWFPAVLALSETRDLKLHVHTKSDCPPVGFRVYHQKWKREYSECDNWRRHSLQLIEETSPALIVVSMASHYFPMAENGEILNGTEAAKSIGAHEIVLVERLRATGARVVLLVDTPRFEFDPVACLVESPMESSSCNVPIDTLKTPRFPWAKQHYQGMDDVLVVDMNDLLCDEEQCYAAWNGRVLFRDMHHLSASTVSAFTSIFEQRISGH